MTERPRGFPAALRAVLAAAVVGGLVYAPARGQDDTPDGLTGDVFPQPRRELLQYLSHAELLLREGRYTEAVERIGAVLEYPEDAFFQPDRQSAPEVYRSLKEEAQLLIARMPREAREAYELRYGTRAQHMLQVAVAVQDLNQVAEVSRRFFHTPAGREATFLLGMDHLDHGRALAAALTLQRLRQSATDVERFEPALSLALAAGWLKADMPKRAEEVLSTLSERHRRALAALSGKQGPPPQTTADALAALGAIVGPPGAAAPAEADAWTMPGGAPSRNAATAGGPPLLSHRWQVPSTGDKLVENVLADLQVLGREEEVPRLPGLHPLAVDDMVLMRTADKLLAVDLATGKRVWEVASDDSLREMVERSGGEAAARWLPAMMLGLNLRMTDDATYGTLTSDGRCVFSVEDLGLGAAGANQAIMIGGAWRVVRSGTVAPATYNRLQAREIRRGQGRLVWEVGGPADSGLPLAGTFFLGPPLPLQGQLFVLAEPRRLPREGTGPLPDAAAPAELAVNPGGSGIAVGGAGMVVLEALDAATGEVLWAQPLSVVDPQEPGLLRHRAGVSPSYADGVLICPTGSGALVAVDLAKRSLLWGYRYRRSRQAEMRNLGAFVVFNQLGRSTSPARWCDSSAIISEGCVVVTPADCDELHAIDLIDGKPLWPPLPRGENLYVACVHKGLIVLVGQRAVQAVQLKATDDGGRALPGWDGRTVELPGGATPGGRGFLSGDDYFLPLSSGEVAVIDLNEGQVARRCRSRSGAVPGNLICYKGNVISQNLDGVDAFYTLETARRRSEQLLAVRPDDPQGLRLQGEVLADAGEYGEAINRFREAYAQDRRPHVRGLLRDALLEGLRRDFATYRGRAAEIAELLDDPTQEAALLRWMAEGLEQSGEPRAAFDEYEKLVELDRKHPGMVEVEPDRSVERNRWIRVRLADLREETQDAAARAEIDRRIEARLEQARAVGGPEPIEQFLAYFGDHPAAAAARRDRLARLLASDRLLEAEAALWEDFESNDATVAGPAAAKLAELLERAGRTAPAAAVYRELSGRLAEVVCRDGKTGRELAAMLPADGPIRQALEGEGDWPEGKVTSAVNTEGIRRQPSYGRLAMGYRGSPAPFYGQSAIRYDQNRRLIEASDGLGRQLWQMSLTEVSPQFQTVPFNASTALVAAQGHLLVFSLGTRLLALDTLGTATGASPRVLWQADLADPGLEALGADGAMIAPASWAWQAFRAGRYGQRLSGLGPVTPEYVCYQRYGELLVVDPLTGRPIWSRDDVPRASELFGDEEMIFVLPPDKEEALVFRAADGELLGRRRVPRDGVDGSVAQPGADANRAMALIRGESRLGVGQPQVVLPPFSETCLATFGRRALLWRAEGDRRLLELYDPWTGQAVWTGGRFAEGSAVDLAGDNTVVAVVEPTGRLALFALPDGRHILDTSLEPPAGPTVPKRFTQVHVWPWSGGFLLLAQVAPPYGRPDDPFSDTPRATARNVQPIPNTQSEVIRLGQVYSFDQDGKPRWPTPATIEDQCLLVDQPRGLPLLVFACQAYERESSRSIKITTSLLCLDKRNGRKVYNEQFEYAPNAANQLFDLEADPQKHTLTLKMQRQDVTLTLTDQPLPPEPEPEKTQPPASPGAIRAIRRSLEKALIEQLPLPPEQALPEPPNAFDFG